MRRMAVRAVAVVLAFGMAASLYAQQGRAPAAAPDLSGVYQAIPNGSTIDGGRKNEGSPADVAPLPAAAQQMKAINLKDDPAKMCQPIGPFRTMARDATKVELIPATG